MSENLIDAKILTHISAVTAGGKMRVSPKTHFAQQKNGQIFANGDEQKS